MAKYRERPVIIDAWLWDETKETFAILEEAGVKYSSYQSHLTENYVRNLRILSLGYTAQVEKGDWVIKEIGGKFFPCKPDVFEARYEPLV
jgi:hypothetical protein